MARGVGDPTPLFIDPASTRAHFLARPFVPVELRARAVQTKQAVDDALAIRGVLWLSYAAALYPLVLCFLNTRVARMPNASLIVAEALIVMGALPILLARLNVGLLLVSLCICVNYVVLAIFQQTQDFKALRDLLLPVMFVWLGYFISDRRLSERVLRNLAIIAVVLGLFEFALPKAYNSLFDALGFYTSRGFASSNPFALSVLQIRPEGIGRSLLPFLGPRRMSSFFLEPVALGNFAVLTAAWALSKPREELRQAIWLMVLATIIVIMADARFGSISIVILCAIRAVNIWKVRLIAGIMPFVAMLFMVLITWYGPTEYHDNVIGRFQVSGRNLLAMTWSGWLGIPDSISLDAGYGYIIQRTGIVICAALWLLFSVVPLKDDQARRFHFNAAVYIALNLCISGSSLFSLKTTAILWLLLGTVIAHRSIVDHLRVATPSPPAATVPT